MTKPVSVMGRRELLSQIEELESENEAYSAKITWLERKIEGLKAGVDCDPITGDMAQPTSKD